MKKTVSLIIASVLVLLLIIASPIGNEALAAEETTFKNIKTGSTVLDGSYKETFRKAQLAIKYFGLWNVHNPDTLKILDSQYCSSSKDKDFHSFLIYYTVNYYSGTLVKKSAFVAVNKNSSAIGNYYYSIDTKQLDPSIKSNRNSYKKAMNSAQGGLHPFTGELMEEFYGDWASDYEEYKISQTNATIFNGQTLQLKVTGFNPKVTWSSSNQNVATISSNGKITTKKAGKTTITAKVGKKVLKCKLMVKNIKLNKTKATLHVGDTLQLEIQDVDKKVSWTTSDKSIATVDKNGLVTANQAGEATITGKVYNTSVECKVKIKKAK